MNKNYTQPPLPFQGNKRNFRKDFIEILDEFDPNGVYLDCFGGSGFLSHLIKQKYPNARVIFNDFDNYMRRIELIPTTNEILSKLEFLKEIKLNTKISAENKEKALKIIKEYKDDEVDFISISSFVLFSGNYADSFESLKKQTWWLKNGKMTKNADGYLDGVEIVRTSYDELINEHKDAILVLDPPYLQTMHNGYLSMRWGLKEFLGLCELIRPPYIFFSSGKSDIIEYFDFVGANNNNFRDYKIKEKSCFGGECGVVRDKDFMIYKEKDE